MNRNNPIRLERISILKVALMLVLPLSVLNNCIAQKKLLLNGGFEELALVDLKNTIIDGQVVRFGNTQDTSRLWSLLSHQKKNSPVSSKYWNFSREKFSYTNSTFYSNTGQSYKGHVFGLIIPYWQSSKSTYYTSNLVGKICKPLKKNNIYEFSFWIRPYEGNYYLDEINLHFSDEKVYHSGYIDFKQKKKGEQTISLSPLINLDTHCTIKLASKYEDGYHKVKCIYKAKGGETYVYIGNLNSDFPKKYRKKNLRPYGLEMSRFSVPVCKYAIDEVILISLTDTTESCLSIKVDTFNTVQEIDKQVQDSFMKKKEDDLIIVNFTTNNYLLQEQEKAYLINELDNIDAKAIKAIFIIGHTDNVGSYMKNLKLSNHRAKEVEGIIVKLLSNKLDTLPPITTIGKSSSEPISFEGSDLSRSRNRRVEVKLEY